MFDLKMLIVLLLAFTLIFCFFIVRFFNKKMSMTKEGLIAADRGLGKFEASLSIAASWIWAPALFISAQKAYQEGVIGLFWFIVPNVLCLILFALFAEKIREQTPEGFTISDYILKRTSMRVQSLYWISLTGLAVCAFAVQLLAGGQLLNKFTGVSFFHATLILSFIPLSYSLFAGLRASIVTDVIKMFLIYALGAFIVTMTVLNGGGMSILHSGLGGKVGTTSFFGAESLKIFLTFGLPSTIGLMAGPFGDQTFWQRAFAIKKDEVKSAYLMAAVLFAIVPLILSLLGFLAAGASVTISDVQMVNIETVGRFLPGVGTGLFIFIILVALISAMDSKLSGISSLGGHDFINRLTKNEKASYPSILRSSRFSMLALVFCALCVANIPGLKVLHLFLFYGTLRSATVLPTIFLILKKPLNEAGVFWGISASIIIGLPIFTYGNIYKIPSLIIAGSCLTIGLSGVIALGWRRKEALLNFS